MAAAAESGEGGRGGTLTAKDGLDLALKAGQNVDKHWTQFFAFVFGLIGWLSSGLSVIEYKEALILTLVTAVFFALNAIATIRAYIVLNLIVTETIAMLRRTQFLSAKVNRFVANRGHIMFLPFRIPIAVLSHAAGAVAIIYLVWRKMG